ncbi:MAG: ABC transporter permease [Patescibacteria group bacterium]|nr:ABC transporter permease [Patescibacteria group bacterium]
MRTKDIFKLSTRMFKARMSRTILTILGMGVGVSAILFLVSLGYGLQNVLLESITTSDSLLSLDATPSNPKELRITQSVLDEIQQVDGVADVSPASQMFSQIYFNNLTSDVTALVVKPSFFKLDGIKIAEGEILSNNNPRGVVISSAFAKIFNKEGDEMINKEFTLMLKVPKDLEPKDDSGDVETEAKKFNEPFKIIGVIELEEPVMYLNIQDITSEVSIPYYSKMKIKCVDQGQLEPVKNLLISQGYAVSSLSDTVDQANKVFKGVQVVLALFGVIALVVSAIGMFNTMTVTLLERTEEIGIMKSIGVSDKDILLMFVFESSIMGALGGICGIAIGFIAGQVMNLLLNLVASRFGGPSVALFQSPIWFMGLIILLGTIVGFITGLVPARRASSIDPLDALRYK